MGIEEQRASRTVSLSLSLEGETTPVGLGAAKIRVERCYFPLLLMPAAERAMRINSIDMPKYKSVTMFPS